MTEDSSTVVVDLKIFFTITSYNVFITTFMTVFMVKAAMFSYAVHEHYCTSHLNVFCIVDGAICYCFGIHHMIWSHINICNVTIIGE